MDRPSLENLIESRNLGIEILHPGGLEITREMAELCHIEKDTGVLEIASGTGESACLIAERFGSKVTGVDISDQMIRRAKEKAEGLNVQFTKAQAGELPFEDDSFDVVISECTLCLLNKEKVLQEMIRVLKHGGYVGIHDLCWKEDTPAKMREELATIEDERPETIRGWEQLFRSAGMEDVRAIDKSALIPEWMRESRRKLGIVGQLKATIYTLRRWGIRGLLTILKSERIFSSPYMGYCIIIGRKHK